VLDVVVVLSERFSVIADQGDDGVPQQSLCPGQSNELPDLNVGGGIPAS
jgi:hypothetical protein